MLDRLANLIFAPLSPLGILEQDEQLVCAVLIPSRADSMKLERGPQWIFPNGCEAMWRHYSAMALVTDGMIGARGCWLLDMPCDRPPKLEIGGNRRGDAAG